MHWVQGGIAHLRTHAVAYAALFFAITGSAAAVTGVQRESQDKSEDGVLAKPRIGIPVGTNELLLRANQIKVVGVCRPEVAEVRIGVIQEEGQPPRGMVVHAESQTRGYVRAAGSGFHVIGSAPDDLGDRGDFNAWTSSAPNGSLDGSFFASHFRERCAFQASAIAG